MLRGPTLILGIAGCGAADPGPPEPPPGPFLHSYLAEVALAVASPAAGDRARRAALVPDADGDGVPDLYVDVSTDDRTHRLAFVPGTSLVGSFGVFTAGTPRLDTDTSTEMTFLAAAGDPNHDGLAELWVGAEDHAVLLPGGTTRPDDVGAALLLGRAEDVLAADLEGDGAVDDLVVVEDERVRRALDAPLHVPFDADRADVALEQSCADLRPEAADLDGDGVAELVIGTSACEAGPAVTALAGDVVLFEADTAIGSAWQGIGGDVDGDGHLDLLAITPDGGHLLEGPLVGERNPRNAALRIAGVFVGAVPLGDADGDGADDTAWLVPEVGTLVFRSGWTGTVTTSDADARLQHGDATSAELGPDLDGDGLGEVVLVAPISAGDPESAFVLSPPDLL